MLWIGDSNKYPHMFLGVLHTVFLNISNYPPNLKVRNHSIQIVLITNFVVIPNAGRKRFDCPSQSYYANNTESVILNLNTSSIFLAYMINQSLITITSELLRFQCL